MRAFILPREIAIDDQSFQRKRSILLNVERLQKSIRCKQAHTEVDWKSAP